MLRFVLASLGAGLLFGILDGLLNANPLASRLYEVFKPIARPSVNAVAGIVIDLIYGFVMGAMFLLLYRSLPGSAGWLKGLSFGLLVWFLRVVMGAISQWMMLNVPGRTVTYTVFAGLAEMLILGLFLGLTLRPSN